MNYNNPSEGLLGSYLSQMLGRPVMAAPSMLNGGVSVAPIQSNAPQNLGAMLLGMLMGGGMSQGGGYPGALYGNDPQEAFYQHMYRRYQQGQLPQVGIPQQPTMTWGPNTGQGSPMVPVTQPTVPQTGPTYGGKTYYPSPIPGSQNPPGSPKPDNNGAPIYPYPTVPAYQPGSWQMPRIPQWQMPQQQNPWAGMNPWMQQWNRSYISGQQQNPWGRQQQNPFSGNPPKQNWMDSIPGIMRPVITNTPGGSSVKLPGQWNYPGM